MDIRNFFNVKCSSRKRKLQQTHGDGKNPSTTNLCDSSPSCAVEQEEILQHENVEQIFHKNDLGQWIGRSHLMSAQEKREMLKHYWAPNAEYNFSEDVVNPGRKFCFNWLQMYTPWLAYSRKLKGSLCLYCVLFPPLNVQGYTGSFIAKPFTRYKHMHEYCKNHISNQWHKTAVAAANNFLTNVPVDALMVSGHSKLIEENRKILRSIITCIVFCGTHDLALRGKNQYSNTPGIFQDLINLKIRSGDQTLQEHVESCKKNAKYLSPQVQNELISISGRMVQAEIVRDIKKASAYSILADETADISGKEQLSVGIRFFDKEKHLVREEFLGFVELNSMDAKTIAEEISKFISNLELDVPKCVGQGYDGCSTMAGKDGGVQAILKNKFKRALYFHCASHKLNLVVNDLNAVPEIRNTIGTIKDIVKFFRESCLRRKYVPNIPMLCETRWSEKYKCIARFKEHFEIIVQGLEKLSVEGNYATRKHAFQLHCAATKPVFIFSVFIIAKYSQILEPVANVLQSKSLDLLQCFNKVKLIMAVVEDHRKNVDGMVESMLSSIDEIALNLGIQFKPPRIVSAQCHRTNPPFTTDAQYWTRSIYIPYIDSLLSSLYIRFNEEKTPAFSLFCLHPSNFLKMTVQQLMSKTAEFVNFYGLDTCDGELELWFKMWEEKKCSNEDLQNMEMIEVFKEASEFFPNIREALCICLAQPCTTATIERSFSTLRRVKTWCRSTMVEDRLNGLCMLSIHRQLVQEKLQVLEENIIKKFAEEPRRLLLKA